MFKISSNDLSFFSKSVKNFSTKLRLVEAAKGTVKVTFYNTFLSDPETKVWKGHFMDLCKSYVSWKFHRKVFTFITVINCICITDINLRNVLFKFSCYRFGSKCCEMSSSPFLSPLRPIAISHNFFCVPSSKLILLNYQLLKAAQIQLCSNVTKDILF